MIAFTLPVAIFTLGVMFFALRHISSLTRILICVYFLADILSITLGQIARGLSHNKAYAISSIILSIANTVCIVFTLCFQNMGLNGVLIAAGISNLISAIYLIKKRSL